MRNLNIKEMIKNYKYFNDISINVSVRYEVNGNVILTEYKYFSSDRHFFSTYVYDRLKENFDILVLDLESGDLVLQKDDVVIRCFW